MEIKPFSAKNKVKEIMEDLLFANENMERERERENRERQQQMRVNWHIQMATKKLEAEIKEISKELENTKAK